MLGERLRTITELAFSKQMQACAAFDIGTLGQLRLYFINQSLPGGRVLSAIASYGFSVDWLLTGNGSMFAATEAGMALRKRLLEEFRTGQKSADDAPDEIRQMLGLPRHDGRTAAGATGQTAPVPGDNTISGTADGSGAPVDPAMGSRTARTARKKVSR